MKILAIGDPHGKLPKGLTKIIKDEKIDVIICVGDIPPVPRVKDPKKAYETLKSINWVKFRKKMDDSYEKILTKLCSYGLPVIVLKGNMYTSSNEPISFVRNLHSKYKNLIYKRTGKVKIKGQNFILFDMIYEPHSHKRTFSTRYDRKVEANKKRGEKLTRMLKELKDPILVSHAPPYKILDRTITNLNVGSKVILSAIKKHPPKLLLCGHIHEDKGKKNTLGTKIYNLGYMGDYEIFEV